MVNCSKQNIMLYVFNFRKRVVLMLIGSYGLSRQEILNTKLPALILLRKNINAQLPDDLSYSELSKLLKSYQVHISTRTCREHNKKEYCFLYDWYFTEKAVIAKLLDCKFWSEENEEVLNWRTTLLWQFTSYINYNPNPAKPNVIDSTKDNFTKPMSLKEIPDKLGISRNDYYQVL